MKRLLRSGIPLSELSSPAFQRALVDATMLDVMLHAEKQGKFGPEEDFKERRSAAVQFAKMKGLDGGESKRGRVLEEIEKMKRFLNAKEIVVEPEEKP